MSATPKRERFCFHLLSVIGLSITCLFFVSACAPSNMASSSATTPDEMDVAGLDEPILDDSGAMDMAAQDAASPIVLSDLSQGLGIELIGKGEEADLVVRSQMPTINYQIERLEQPTRIKITLPNTFVEGSGSKEMMAEQSPLIDQVSYSSSDEGTEIQVDIADAASVAYESEPIAGNLYVRIMPETSMVQLNDGQLNDSAMNDALAMDAASAPVAKPFMQASTQPVLKALHFEEVPNVGQVVVADMESAGIFSLKKTAPSEYVLRLEGATFEEGNFPTLMAPPTTNGIRTVRVVREGSDTLLRIFANPNIQLEAAPKTGGIVLRPTSDYLASTAGQIRAQAEVDQAVEAAEGAAEGEATEAVDDGTGDLDELEGDISALLDEAPKYTGRKISLDLQDTDIDNALRIIAEVSNLNIIASDDVTGKVTLRLIDVPWDQALDVILKTNGLDKVLEGNVMRIAPIEKLRQEREALKQAREAEEELEPLVVKYIRVSYAKAADLRPLVETVLTERGTVTFDDRTNQLIIKDIRRGVKNVAELVARLDLRTPQVLLETQIVEATRSFSRSLGSELGFSYIQSPETGNATGYNFPNSIEVAGSVADGGVGSSFPVAVADTGGSAVSFLLDSADGTRSLDFRLTALEDEGAIRIVSRPSVATTNNQQATIRSVEKVRIKTPSGGLSVATGAGANASGSGGVATETIEIGIVLEVTPQASPDYFVLLDINAKSSTFGSERVDDIPSEVERSATSSVLVSSGQTFAMGGIYKISDSDSVSGVPFLKDIPFFGYLFRRQTVDNNDEELIFFITPRIIEGSFDDAAMKLSS